ncbi:XTP/dITP diphosphatase [Candidatus Latescibacterota bacterium]
MMRLLIATTNPGKIREIATLLAGVDISLVSLADYPDMHDIIEDGATFTDNAIIKAREASEYSGLTALADDSGLVVDALDGQPGVLSARFAPTSAERNDKLLRMLGDVPDERRTARFVCAVALVRPDGFEWTASGTCEGVITREPHGGGGFGYDPVFFFPALGKTFAELSGDEKNAVSHRGNALRVFRDAVINDHIIG